MEKDIICKRIDFVKEKMKKEKIDAYIVFTSDYHMSEYAGDHFKEREYLSGFTGSAGTLVVMQDKTVLFTDGRYFVQAENQLKDSNIQLMKMGVDGVFDLFEYLDANAKNGFMIGMDARTCDVTSGKKIIDIAKKHKGGVNQKFDPICEMWKDRPQFPVSEAFELDMKYCGENRKTKIQKVRNIMKLNKAKYHIIASLDDICWLLNIRGNDVSCNPVIMAYCLISENEICLYTQEKRFSKEILHNLKEDGIIIKEYDKIYEDLEKNINTSILLDTDRINLRLYESIMKDVKKIEILNPTVKLKAVKNETEIKNLKEIHILDGLAVTRFMMWLKKRVKDKNTLITEYDAASYLDELRKNIKGFIELSFDTISAYNANAAMMHYQAEKDNCSVLNDCGMLLVDSGGQYFKGTTDVTRTFALGNVTDDMKHSFTLTLKGMLNLANAKFLYGCTGRNLDILARGPLWEEGIDYRCGTGHGIGYLLNVHESPNNFRWKNRNKNDDCILEEGMVTSDEPGVYKDGEYGIRIENEILCVKDFENEYGTFMKFEMLTLVPIDKDLIDVKYLNEKDKKRLNDYHKMVYDKLSCFMNDAEKQVLKYYTDPL